MTSADHQILIVGNGPAGLLLKYFLDANHISSLLVGSDHPSAAHFHSSGIINPITGRRLVKSWNIDNLIPMARHTYLEIEKLVGHKLLYQKNVLRIFESAGEQNDYNARTIEAPYKEYLEDAEQYLSNHNRSSFGEGYITNAYQVDVKKMVHALREYYTAKQQYIRCLFAYDQLYLDDSQPVFQGIKFERVIFAEGFLNANNPWFQHLPIIPNKGVYAYFSSSTLNNEIMYKRNMMFAKLPTGNWWVGATHNPGVGDSIISDKDEQELMDSCSNMLSYVPSDLTFDVGIRATTKDRMPYIGWHHTQPCIGIFNGFGAKGLSLIPWCAHNWVANGIFKNFELKSIGIQRTY